MKKKGWYEIRMVRDAKKPFLDEIVAEGANFHMEMLSENCYWFCLTWPNGERLAWNIYPKNAKAHIDGLVIETPNKTIPNTEKKH